MDYQLGLSDVSGGDFYLLKHKLTTIFHSRSVRAWRGWQEGDEALGKQLALKPAFPPSEVWAGGTLPTQVYSPCVRALLP